MFEKIYLGNKFINKVFLGDILIKYNTITPPSVFKNLSSVVQNNEVKILNDKGQSIRSLPVVAYKSVIDSEGNLYCCTSSALCKYNSSNAKVFEIPNSKSKIGCDFRESTNTIITFKDNNLLLLNNLGEIVSTNNFNLSIESLDIFHTSDFFVGLYDHTVAKFDFKGNVVITIYEHPLCPIIKTIVDKNDTILFDVDSKDYRPYSNLHTISKPPYAELSSYKNSGLLTYGWCYNGQNGILFYDSSITFYTIVEGELKATVLKTINIKATDVVSVDCDDNGDFYCLFTENGRYMKVNGQTGDIMWEILNCNTDYIAYVQKTK